MDIACKTASWNSKILVSLLHQNCTMHNQMNCSHENYISLTTPEICNEKVWLHKLCRQLPSKTEMKYSSKLALKWHDLVLSIPISQTVATAMHIQSANLPHKQQHSQIMKTRVQSKLGIYNCHIIIPRRTAASVCQPNAQQEMETLKRQRYPEVAAGACLVCTV